MSTEIIIAAITSTGIYGLITYLIQRSDRKKEISVVKVIEPIKDAVCCILGQEIIENCKKALERGWIDEDDLESINRLKFIYDTIECNCSKVEGQRSSYIETLTLKVLGLSSSPHRGAFDEIVSEYSERSKR